MPESTSIVATANRIAKRLAVAMDVMEKSEMDEDAVLLETTYQMCQMEEEDPNPAADVAPAFLTLRALYQDENMRATVRRDILPDIRKQLGGHTSEISRIIRERFMEDDEKYELAKEAAEHLVEEYTNV